LQAFRPIIKKTFYAYCIRQKRTYLCLADTGTRQPAHTTRAYTTGQTKMLKLNQKTDRDNAAAKTIAANENDNDIRARAAGVSPLHYSGLSSYLTSTTDVAIPTTNPKYAGFGKTGATNRMRGAIEAAQRYGKPFPALGFDNAIAAILINTGNFTVTGGEYRTARDGISKLCDAPLSRVMLCAKPKAKPLTANPKAAKPAKPATVATNKPATPKADTPKADTPTA
jgi:hypothetical protein